jgi:hypothetical protein
VCVFFLTFLLKRAKAEHVVRGIPLRLFIRGLGCSNLILYIYICVDPRGECYCCVVAVLSLIFCCATVPNYIFS